MMICAIASHCGTASLAKVTTPAAVTTMPAARKYHLLLVSPRLVFRMV